MLVVRFRANVKAKLIIESQLFEAISTEQFKILTPGDMLFYLRGQQSLIVQMRQTIRRLEEKVAENEVQTLCLDGHIIELNHQLFGKSSERETPRNPEPPKSKDFGNGDQPPKEPKKRVLLPSERYPNLPVIETDVTFKAIPPCACCGEQLEDSGLTEVSENLTVTPAKYSVIRQKRRKFRCRKCHGDLQTVPAPPRIKASSAFTDDMILDVALSKYCDLIPIQRYVAIAERLGIKGLPQQSLIESTHYLADFVKEVYALLKQEVLSARVLHADETPHRMLEGADKNSWYLWGFSTRIASYFEAHDTRSGDVASALLAQAACQFLMSDVYSGYGKAVREANEVRKAGTKPAVVSIYCNAHSRRRFKAAKRRFTESAQFFIDQYQKIYLLEDQTKGKPPDQIRELRKTMLPIFESMKAKALETVVTYSKKSEMAVAMNYFLGHYRELTRFIEDPELPIDNNPQERLLRNPVIGRKTWYGTHSKLGAKTAAILFSLVESCKLNGVNPRAYFKRLVADLHAGLPAYTPAIFKAQEDERARFLTSASPAA